MSETPVALVSDARFYVGPDLVRSFARRGYRIVAGDASDELVGEIEALGVECVSVRGAADLSDPSAATRLVDACLSRHGRIDSAVMFSGRIITGRFADSSLDQLRRVVAGCLEEPYNFLRAVVPEMTSRRSGQILVITSAAGARPTPGAPLYSAARAAATMLVRNVAGEIAATGVQVNAVGTNFMDFPAFLEASGASDPEVRARIESQVPMRRLGTMEEFAHFCMTFLDGRSGFTTGQFVAYAGGWA